MCVNLFIKSRLSLIVRVNVVLNRTVVVDSVCEQQQSYSGLRSPVACRILGVVVFQVLKWLLFCLISFFY